MNIEYRISNIEVEEKEQPKEMIAGEDLTLLLTSLLEEKIGCTIRVHGTSMAPSLVDGDTVEITPWIGDEIAVGDIVAIKPSAEANPLVHRVIDTRNEDKGRELLIKGDRCVYNDGWMAEADVIGKVDRVMRGDRQVNTAFGRTRAFLSRCGIFSRLVRIAAVLLFVTAASLAQKPGAEPADPLKPPKGRPPLVVLKQAEIQGQVFFIADKDGKQVAAEDVRIEVQSLDTGKRLHRTKTDEEGKYVIPNFDIGKYRFIVGRLKLELEVTEAAQPGVRAKRVSKKIIVFIPEEMR